MPKNRRINEYLFKRRGCWYFRFRAPSAIQSVSRRTELRLSLGTGDLKTARNSVTEVLPYIYEVKRLSRRMDQLKPEHVRTILDQTFTRMVDALERTKEPWMRTNESLDPPGMFPIPIHKGFQNKDFEKYERDRAVAKIRAAVAKRDPTRWRAAAEKQLRSIGVEPDLASSLFGDFCVELGKLELLFIDAQKARSNGDYEREEEFVEYYKRNGYRVVPSALNRTGTGPRLSEAWKEYLEEKITGRPRPDWSPKTASGQQATFDEFLELVTDLRVNQVSRDDVRDYLRKAAQLPKNRRKLFAGKPIPELLELDFKPSQLPSSRTVAEKLVQIGSFLKWCRVSKNYIGQDPTEGLSVRATSRSYAPFNHQDLERLFGSPEYEEGKHRKLWHFWVPLIALYTGARQAEIGQLLVRNVVEEDGIWILTITDTGDGQRVKTEAGVRKVPISSVLIELGLVEYVETLNRRGLDRLFPDLKRGSLGWGQRISRWFNDTYKKNCGVIADPTGGRKVFHSFRHTAITKATSSGLPIQHCQQVFGHEKSILGETATYTSQFPTETLLPVTESLDYGIDHSRYRHGWKSLMERF